MVLRILVARIPGFSSVVLCVWSSRHLTAHLRRNVNDDRLHDMTLYLVENLLLIWSIGALSKAYTKQQSSSTPVHVTWLIAWQHSTICYTYCIYIYIYVRYTFNFEILERVITFEKSWKVTQLVSRTGPILYNYLLCNTALMGIRS